MGAGYNVNKESGYAPRQVYMRLNDADVAELTGSENKNNSTPIRDRRYALTTFQVNATPIVVSGNLSANVVSVGLNADGTVQLSGDQLKVFDQEVVDGINTLNTYSANYSQIVRVNGNFTYIMIAPPGSPSGNALWQVKRIEASGDDTNILWADGNDNFDNIASNYLSLTYTL